VPGGGQVTVQSSSRPQATFRAFARDTVVLVPAFLGSGLFSLLTIVAFARLLGPERYGLLAVMQTTALIVATATGQWLRQATLRYLPRFREEGRESEAHWGLIALLLASAGASLLLYGIGWVMWSNLSHHGTWSNLTLPLLLATASYTIANLLFDNLLVCHQAALDMGRFSRLRVLGYAAAFLLALASLLLLGFTVDAVLWGYAVAFMTISLVSLRYLLHGRAGGLREIPGNLARGFALLVTPYARYGLPLGLWALIVSLLNWSDRWLLLLMRGELETGIYASLYAFTSLGAGLFFSPLLGSLHAHTMSLWARNDREALARFYSHLALHYVQLSALALVAVMAWGDRILGLVLGAGYEVPAGLTPLLFLGFVLWQGAMMAHKGLEASGATRQMLGAVLVALAINVLLNLLLIPGLGLYAAAIASIAGFGCYILLTAPAARAHIHWQVPREMLARSGALLAVLAMLYGAGASQLAGSPGAWLLFQSLFGITGTIVMLYTFARMGTSPLAGLQRLVPGRWKRNNHRGH
jgi:O-antigen/teichoic acid export membrane protein